MTGEDRENESNFGFEHLLSDLRLEILARLCESVDGKAQVEFDVVIILDIYW